MFGQKTGESTIVVRPTCSAYAITVALEMCEGDFEAAIELAVGAPLPRNEARKRAGELLADYSPTETADPDATAIAHRLQALLLDVERTFPHARRFVRPGFDEPS